MFDQPERVLIVGPAWVGDMVMAQSLYIALKQKNPDCLIDVIAPS
jgi:heptosyltransferase-2